MIGDHEQLRPVVQSTRLRRDNNLDLSMFERLANCHVPLKQLQFQGRMRDEIAELLRKLDIYKELKTNGKVNASYYRKKTNRRFGRFSAHALEVFILIKPMAII